MVCKGSMVTLWSQVFYSNNVMKDMTDRHTFIRCSSVTVKCKNMYKLQFILIGTGPVVAVMQYWYFDEVNVHELIILVIKAKAVPLHAMKALGGRGGIGPTHTGPRHIPAAL
jgi:hypothetical protein